MLSRYRLVVLFVLAFAAVIIFVATGLPRAQLSTVLAESAAYSYGSPGSSKEGPGQSCDGTDISAGRLGTVVVDSPIFWEPKDGSTIGSLGVSTGQTFWIIKTDESGAWDQIVIACEKVWVPAGAMQ